MNMPALLSGAQRFILQPLQPVWRAVFPDLRNSVDTGFALNHQRAGRRGYVRLMVPGSSSTESLDKLKQEKLLAKTIE
jgi:hypothetical protein